MRIAVLDDYGGFAREMAPWSSLGGAQVVFFADPPASTEALRSRLAPFDVVVAMRERTRFPAETLQALPRLRLLVTTGARNAAIDLEAAAALGVTVCGTAGVPGLTAEHTWALILALTRRIVAQDAAVRRGAYLDEIGVQLRGRTLGIVGLGRIGTDVARIGAAFGMHVLAWSPTLTGERAEAVGARATSFTELLRTADVVSLHVRSSAATAGLLGDAELGLMSPRAFLVNTSRGSVVNEGALVRRLRAGQLAGAALDVYAEEPLPAGHPLTSLPNVVLTPHAGYVSEESYRVYYTGAVEAIRAFAEGAPVNVLASPAGA